MGHISFWKLYNQDKQHTYNTNCRWKRDCKQLIVFFFPPRNSATKRPQMAASNRWLFSERFHSIETRVQILYIHEYIGTTTKRFSHLLHLPRTGSYPLTPAQNQRTIILVSSILQSTNLHLYFSQLLTVSQLWLSILAYLLFQHGTKKSLPPLQHTCSCQPYRRQLTMSTQPQLQTGVTLSPHHRQQNIAPQDQTQAQAYRTPRDMNRLRTYTTLS